MYICSLWADIVGKAVWINPIQTSDDLYSKYPLPPNKIYPQMYNPANAPPAGQQGQPGYPNVTPQYSYQQPQPGFAYPYSSQPQRPMKQASHPASMSYPNVTHMAQPSAPPPTGFGVGYPGFSTVSPTPVEAIEWEPSTCHTASALSKRAVIAGHEGWDGSPLWVIRARFQGDLIPGMLAIMHNTAYVSWNGKENPVHSFEVCCARPETIRWVESKNGVIVPPNAVPGGQTASGEQLYIGRAKHNCSLTPGKVHPSHKCLYISYGGDEIAHNKYEVLCTV